MIATFPFSAWKSLQANAFFRAVHRVKHPFVLAAGNK
jgi:hypothetical protein